MRSGSIQSVMFVAAAAAAAVALTSRVAGAATPGIDNTAQPAYADGWQSGDNGGTGFTGWNLIANTSNGGFAGHFLGDSTNISNPGANINTGGNAFGMYGGKGGEVDGFGQADAYRSFDADLAVGQTFSIDLVVNFRNGYKGIDLRSGESGEPTIFNFNVGGDDHVVNNALTGNGSIGNDYSNDTAFHLAFTQDSVAGGTWSITRSGGISDFDTGTYSGVPRSIKLYVGQTDGGSPNDLFANNLAIVPEPSSAAVLLMAAGSVAARRRRARS